METPVGYVDPGSNPHPSNQLAKANCPTFSVMQNMVGTQDQGKLYYRVTKPIHKDTELMVDYGTDYRKELKISSSRFATFPGKEDHSTEAVPCTLCAISFASEESLHLHLNPANGKEDHQE